MISDVPKSRAKGAPVQRKRGDLHGSTMGDKGRATRRKLIQATAQMLESTPLRDIKVTDIARLAQTSSPTFYLYFDNVTDAVLAAVQELSQSTPTILKIVDQHWDSQSAHDLSLLLVRTYVAYWDEHRGLFRARNMAAEEGDMRFHEARMYSLRPLLEALAKQVKTAQRAERVDPGLEPLALAGALLAMLDRLGSVSHMHRASTAVTHDKLLQAAANIVAATLGCPSYP